MAQVGGINPQVSQAFHSSAGGLNFDFDQVCRGGGHYVSPEIQQRMGSTRKDLQNMSFDSSLLESSKEWQNKFNPTDLNEEKAGAAQNLNSAQRLMNDYKTNFTNTRVEQLQPNQVREAQQWAKNGFNSVHKSIAPYADASQKRIDQFSDYIGVTDRYTGYRNNLTRGQKEPTRLGMTWLDRTDRLPYRDSMSASHSGNFLPACLPKPKYTDGGDRMTQSAQNPWQLSGGSSGMMFRKPPPERSIQEQCGINTTFPGKTEYMKRYNKIHPPQPVTTFNINPSPDFGIYGRPMTKAKYSPTNTEYQARYEWPDGSRVVRKPWLRT